MKFIGRVSTVNLADISPGGETKSGLSHEGCGTRTFGDPLGGGLLVSTIFRNAPLFAASPLLLFIFPSVLVPCSYPLPASAAECQPNDGKKKLKAAAEAMVTAAR